MLRATIFSWHSIFHYISIFRKKNSRNQTSRGLIKKTELQCIFINTTLVRELSIDNLFSCNSIFEILLYSQLNLYSNNLNGIKYLCVLRIQKLLIYLCWVCTMKFDCALDIYFFFSFLKNVIIEPKRSSLN